MRKLSDQLERIGFRGPGFDRIRLIAALMVVLHHGSFYSVDDIAHDALHNATGGAVNIGRLAVDTFFVTSGILVTPGLLRSGDLVTFAVNRFLRIMPALVAVVAATAFVVGPLLTTLTITQYFSDPETYLYLKNIIFRMVRNLPGLKDAGGDPLLVNGALWTIYFEVLCYLALVLLFVTGILKRPLILGAIFGAVYCVYLYSHLLDRNPFAIRETILVFCELFVYFLAGICIVVFSKNLPWNGVTAILFLLAAILSFPMGLTYYTLPVTLSYLVAYVGYSNVLGGKSFEVDLSYGVYLIHAVIITLMIIMLPQIDDIIVALPIVIATSVFFAFLSWTFIEEPCMRRKKLASDAAHRMIGLLRSKYPKPDRAKSIP